MFTIIFYYFKPFSYLFPLQLGCGKIDTGIANSFCDVEKTADVISCYDNSNNTELWYQCFPGPIYFDDQS